MKVLFAVSNENISSAIIKRYPKDYREILSYKNVYYFNAILKEIQKDKSYDRIVISEDLEPFVNTNHDSIDNFIFEHLDKISDEAHDNDGKETSIILICSERRTPGSSILNKLFSIGVYNAVMGKDRNLTELCKLINRPRTKKEAKIYYRIEQANYDPVAENEVNEIEIQNILAHFKKLGKNTERYADSFNNIAAQYTDEQLKIIVNVLPIKVKAILEAESPKYQSLMGTSGNPNSVDMNMNNDLGISINTIGEAGKINGPIVIPTGVKKVQPRQVTASNSVQSQVRTQSNVATNQNATRPRVNQAGTQAQPTVANQPIQQRRTPQTIAGQQVRPVQSVKNNVATNNAVSQPVKTTANPQVTRNVQQVPTNKVVQSVKPATTAQPAKTQQVNSQQVTAQKVNTQTVEPQQVASVQPNQSQEKVQVTNKVNMPKQEQVVETKIEEKPKRGRGRPRKNPVVQEPQEDNTLNNLLNSMDNSDKTNNEVLPGMEEEPVDDSLLPGMEEEPADDSLLPGMEEEPIDDSLLPGMEEEPIDDSLLPGMEEEPVDDSLLPGMEEEPVDDSLLPGMEEEPVDDSLLPGMEEEPADDSLLPGMEEEPADDSLLPGMEEEPVDDSLLPGMEEEPNEEGEEVDVDSLLSELDINDEINDLPNLDAEDDVNPISDLDNMLENDEFSETKNNSSTDPLISNIDENDEETVLPGMLFNNTSDDGFSNNNYTNSEPAPKKQEVVDIIKPKVNYSMSNLNSLLSKDKKIVAFIGTTKNGTSFLVNNLALMFSMMGINTAILDMTENRNSYYIFTDSREELRNIAYTSIGKLENGYAEGIKINKNMTVYTALPADGNKYENAEPILSTLVQNHSLVLIDCDFQTPPAYFASSQEIYLVQSMDILTIQPLTAFLRELKFKGAWEPEKARVVINKETKIKALNEKMIIAGMSRYNGPDMSVMTDLFNKDMVKACSIPFDEKVYSKYLETMATCKLSLSGYSKPFMQKMQILGEMVYPRLNSKKTYGPMDNANNPEMINNASGFSSNMNNTLNQMKNKY